MLSLITFSILFFVLAVAVAGFAKLFMLTIEPGEIFERWQVVLKRLKPRSDFWWRSLGGCEDCTRQRIAELTFAGFVFLFVGNVGAWPPHNIEAGWATWFVRCMVDAGTYILFCGLAMYFGQAVHRKDAAPPKKIQDQYPDEKIIRSTPTPRDGSK